MKLVLASLMLGSAASFSLNMKAGTFQVESFLLAMTVSVVLSCSSCGDFVKYPPVF
jgi:hypothetical protein